MAYKRILVPVDGSPTSNKGMQEAIRLAKSSRARLRLVHVVEQVIAFSAPEVAVNIGPILDSLRAAGRRRLAGIEGRARKSGVKPETALVENFGMRVADAVIAQAKRWRADLIVMGTHGRRGLQRALVGSDAELVVRYSPVPVLLVPPGGRRRR
ncbi:MAG: universal stress protein [Burkholderiales bacterium]